MKILHSSDWHLGRTLYGRKRYEEFAAFLQWLSQVIEEEQVDVLLVAGDVFDTSAPSNQAQKLYYQFLCQIAASRCRHVVVIGGNHDSPTFLNAPKDLLRTLDVHVVGATSGVYEDEVIVLKNADVPEAIICAVPYLRDKDIRTVVPGETIDDKNAKMVEGLKKHYGAVCKIAEEKRAGFEHPVPIIAMGHLFAAGGKTTEDDGVRELYVGSLAHVGSDVFPSSIDYLALGHLHVPQAVGGLEHLRYCGSPIPMGYGEAKQQKQVILVEFKDGARDIRPVHVPCFQELVRMVGSLEEITAKISELKAHESKAWLEIEYTGTDIVPDLNDQLLDAIEGSQMEIRRIKNRRIMDRVLNQVTEEETLDDLSEDDVFARCLDAFEVEEEDRADLLVTYNEIVKSIHEDDVNA